MDWLEAQGLLSDNEGKTLAASLHPHVIRFIARSSSNRSLKAEVENLEKQIYQLQNNAVRERLQRLLPEYKPHLD